MIVLDTHAWLWWLHDPLRLSPKAQKMIEKAEKKEGWLVSVISLWEIAVKLEIGKMTLPHDIHSWFEKAKSYPGLILEPLVPEDAIASTQLPGIFHKDPADRIIIALTRRYGATLITKDKEILNYSHVKSAW
jgi:PIN domain nuclease of toxin-antitoxin system